MKRKLLLAALCVVGALCFKVKAQEAGTYYFYNDESGKYLSRGATWGTHAVADTYGIAFTIAKESEGVYTLKNVDHSLMVNGNRYLGENLYTDNGTACNYTFAASGEGYTLKQTNGYLTIASADSYGQTPIETTADAAQATVWRLLTKEQYNTALATRDAAAAQALATKYGLTGVTDLASLKSKLAYGATTNKTSSVGNAAIGGGSSAWAKDKTENNRGIGDSKAGDGVFQTWQGCVDINQTVSGLTEGIYKITAEAFLRFGDKEAAKRVTDNGCMTTYLYGNDSKTLLHSFWTVKQDNDHPNSMSEASSQVIDKDDRALLECYAYVPADGKLRLGIYLAGGFDAVWMICDNFTLTQIANAPTAENDAAIRSRADFCTAQTIPTELKSALTEAYDAYKATANIENYLALLTAVEAAEPIANEKYLLSCTIASATSLGVASATIAAAQSVYDDTSATNAAVTEANQNLKVAEYNYVTATYQYSVPLSDSWTSEATGTSAATFSNEHWSGTTHEYKNQNDNSGQGWNNSSGWSINFNQDVTLPAGNYVFKVAGRQASGDAVNTGLIVKNDDTILGEVNDFPRSNNSRGINKNGITSFDASDEAGFANNGNGFGWEWRYVHFTLDEDATVNVAINSVATAIHQWVSFGDYAILTDNAANVSLIAYNIALNSATTTKDNSDYENVKGTEKAALLAAIATDETLDKTNATDIDAATTALNDATSAFIAAKTKYDALATAITNATSITTAAVNVGDAAFQIPTTAKTTLETATATATTTWNDAATDAAAAATAATTLNDAITAYNNAELNVPNESDVYSLFLTDGLSKTVTFKDGNAAAGTYAIGYTEDAGSAFNQTIHFKAAGTVNQYYLYIVDAEGTKHYLCAGNTYSDGNTAQIRMTSDDTKALAIEIVPTSEAGKYNLKNTAANGLIGSNGDAGVYTASTYKTFNINPATKASVPVAIAKGKWGTRIFPFAVTSIPDGLEAYTITGTDDTRIVKSDALTSIPANTPVILKATKDVDETLEGYGVAKQNNYTSGLLTGVYTNETIAAGSGTTTKYVLQTQDDVQAFYVVDANFTATAYRCYLTVPSTSAKALYFDFDDATAIAGIDAAEVAEDAVYYNLAGQRVAKPVKGIYIVNGKKVLVK